MTALKGTETALARRLDDAQQRRTDTPSLADDHTIDIDQAYRIQNELLELRTERGESIVGIKLGFTSEAKMAQMGVSEVIVGQLTDAMCVNDGGEIDLSEFIHPKIEPEVAYRLSKDVDFDDPNVDIEACVDAVAPAMEIIDSRYRDFRFTYTDVVADNTSAAGYVIGRWLPLQNVADRSVRMEVGDQTVLGSTEAILGDPARALHALLDIARRRRIPLRAGHVILAGAATAAVRLDEGVAQCSIDGLGTVTVIGVRQ